MLKRCGHDELVECDCDAPQSPPASAAGVVEEAIAFLDANARWSSDGDFQSAWDTVKQAALQSQPVGVVTGMTAEKLMYIADTLEDLRGIIPLSEGLDMDCEALRDELHEWADALLARPRADGGDGERLDWLEAEANKQGGILLHDGSETGRIGLGLRPGTLTRTLRQAIDAAMGKEAATDANG